jgi:hypothetical protein
MNPTAAHPAPTDGFVRDPKIERQLAELRELAARYPEPTLDDVMPEWKWVHGMLANETPGDDWPHWDRHVAVYQKQVVGSDLDPLQLRIDKSRELGVHPERLIVTYVGDV